MFQRKDIEEKEIIVIPSISEDKRIGYLLHGARLRAGMTQKELAAAIDVPLNYIAEYENNKRVIPQSKAEDLARVLKTVPTHFLPKNTA